MMAEGLWLSRTQRRTFHQPRLRRESYGELIQIDGSDHRWFEQRGEPCTLLVFIDDATSKLMQLRFVPSESTDSYFEALERISHNARLPYCLLLRQAHRLPGKPAGCQGRFGDDAVRARTRRTEHRDPMCELKPRQKAAWSGRIARCKIGWLRRLRMAGICNMDRRQLVPAAVHRRSSTTSSRYPQ